MIVLYSEHKNKEVLHHDPKIIHIDQEKCNGCGACADACHEGAIGMVDGKARLLRDDYCDGLGDCLPACPTGAITFVEREAAAYDEKGGGGQPQGQGANARPRRLPRCPEARQMHRQEAQAVPPPLRPARKCKSQLGQWPCQIKLAPVNAPWFDGAKLLVAADCAAYAYGVHAPRFHAGQNHPHRLP